MLRGLTWKQFAELLAYKKIEPFCELRADYRIASIVQLLANINRGKGQPPMKLDDARLKFGEKEEKPAQTWQQQLEMIKLFAVMHNRSPETQEG